MTTLVATAADFARIFEAERTQTYPAVDAFEAETGYAINRAQLEAAARVLACPVKAHPPNWQHGRVLYAATRRYLAGLGASDAAVTLLDIGTAKGFSALCLRWAMLECGCGAGRTGRIISTDVIDPRSHAIRNTVAEVDGLKTLAEILAPWPEAATIEFWHATGQDALARLATARAHVGVAFLDGKHAFEVVQDEGERLAALQQPGDLAIFDDGQIDGVWRAVQALRSFYTIAWLDAASWRRYAIGVRR